MPTIGVIPPAEFRRRPLLFAALEALFAVRFQERHPGELSGLDAALVFGGPRPVDDRLPLLRYELLDERRPDAAVSIVELGRSDRVDGRLRGRRLPQRGLLMTGARLDGGEPLAWDDLGALWVLDGRSGVESAVAAPSELASDEPVRERLRPGRFLELLPLVHLLRRAVSYEAWRRPPLRAVFTFDDPNLHLPSYGYIRYADLAHHARTHGYHAAMAIVPLDCWYAHPGAAKWFRRDQPLSLTMHGNDHLFQELRLPVDVSDAAPLFEQALRRVSRLERRAGVDVDRIMVPPHEACSDEMMEAMLQPGIEAVCRAPVWWSDWAPQRVRTAGWDMSDVSPSGTPILGRHDLLDVRSRDEITLNLYLDQPAIFYGHHVDVAGGYGPLADLATWLNDFEGLTWGPLSYIARTNSLARLEGDVQHVRLFSRAAVIDVEPGTRLIEVEIPEYERYDKDRLVCNGREHEIASESGVVRAVISVAEGTVQTHLRLARQGTPSGARRRVAARAVARRTTRELRDRLHPTLRRVGLDRVLRRVEIAYVDRMNARVKAQARTMRDKGRR